MRFIDWIAILGALAWTPHLINVVKFLFLKPKVRIITPKDVDIGFTTYGPIFNLRLALAVEHKDIVVSDIKIKLKHESGEEKLFEWQGITQHFGKMKMPDTEMPYEKEHSILAIKLNPNEIEERFVRFQEPKFIQSKQELTNEAIRKLNYLNAEGKFEADDFLRGEEMTALYSFNKQAFTWKQGKYQVLIEIQSPEKFTLVDNIREFSLTHVDIEQLGKNKDQLELDYKGMVVGSDDVTRPRWQWCYPELVKN